MHRIRIGRGVDRDRRDPKLFAGALDTKRDFSPVGDQDFVEHRRKRLTPLDDDEGLAIFDRLTVIEQNGEHRAGVGEGIWFIVFIASMMSSVSPAVTLVPTSMKGAAPGSAER